MVNQDGQVVLDLMDYGQVRPAIAVAVTGGQGVRRCPPPKGIVEWNLDKPSDVKR